MRWRTLITPPATGAENMALDEVLMQRAGRTGEAVIRVYGWSAPTLSLGRNQLARGCYDLSRARELGVHFVRRPTGGRAVLHHREVTYSVTAPADGLGALGESYGRINRLLVDGLRRVGVPAEIAAPVAGAPPPSTAPCFETPVPGEIIAGGRKLIGSAQYREHDALLQHGSILVEDDQHLAAVLLVTTAPPPPPPATLRALLGRVPSMEEVASALFESFADAEGAEPAPLALDEALDEAMRHARRRYDDDAWTWRR
ncbi:MAG TPA: lipoate--protein ligase family protein [Gemmatimonadaceae bacterium]|nr:lipoate--protein ligase family protein [Gemmatimonadaceae bacterium]